jgi:excinuclease ABC subunit C
MLDAANQLIYVGKAKRLRSRLLSYFRPRSRDPKAGRILRQARSIVWEFTGSEFAALLRELELIRHWAPRFNVHGRPGRRRFVYVCLGRRPAPYAFLARRPVEGTVACLGPISGGGKAAEALRWLNNWFKLRDCPQKQEMFFADQRELVPSSWTPGCLRYEIGTCLGPCIGACTRQRYRKHVRAAKAFLDGTTTSLLAKLQAEMQTASARLAFERAALLRDKLQALGWLHERLCRLRRLRDHEPFVYRVANQQGAETGYLIQGGHVRAVAPLALESSAQACEALTEKCAFKPAPLPANPEELFLIASWFRRHPEERSRVWDPHQAIALYRAS